MSDTMKKLEVLLYRAIVELDYIQSVENCNSGLCATPVGKEIIEQGMRALKVKDLSLEWQQFAGSQTR